MILSVPQKIYAALYIETERIMNKDFFLQRPKPANEDETDEEPGDE